MSRAYKIYALSLMTAIYTVNLTDRALMGLMLESIKADLQLSDTQLGFVTGIAFALFYATAGLPLARWADRGNRARIAAIAIGLWSCTVMTCLFIASYWQLVLARIGAAVGEAGCKPPTYSLIGDYFPGAAERTRAMAVYWLGSPLAGLIAFIIGGWLLEHIGWRETFFAMALPGLILALLTLLTLRDRWREPPQRVHSQVLPSYREVVAILWTRHSSRHLVAAVVLFFFLGYGSAPWFAALLIRVHSLSTAEVGLWLGLTLGGCGIVGVLAGGFVSSRLFRDNERSQLRFTGIVVAMLVPMFTAFLFAPRPSLALLALALFQILINFFFAPTFSILQRLVPDDMRATTLAIVMLLANLIGMGIGPQLVGILSDIMRPTLGDTSLRVALLLVSFVALWSAFHFWRASDAVADDLVGREGQDRNRQPEKGALHVGT